MQNSVAKKIFAVGSAVAMTLSLAVPFVASAAIHADGTNVSKADGTVGMMIGGQFRPYTSAGAFLSYGFNSWASVVTASAEDLAAPVGAFIPPQDGKVMCSDRGSDKGTCYLVTGSQKAGFTSAAVFTGLGFSFSKAGYGDVSWMASTSNIDNTTAAHRPGVLVNNNGTVQLVGATGLLGIPDLATFNSWGYSFTNVVPANAADKAMTQTGVMAARVAGQLSPTALAGGVNPPSVISGSVSAMLASDSPAAQTLAVSSAVKSVVTLAKFAFSGNGTVTQLQVKRIGVSSDTDLSNVYLFNGNARLTDAASVGGSSLVTFSNPNGLFTVSGNTTISVVAEIPANTSSGKTIGVQLTSFTVANGSPATVAVSGNLVTTSNVGTDLAYATYGSVTPTGGAYDPAVDTEVFRSNVTVNNRDMIMSKLIIRNIGTIQTADLNNFRLRIDGSQVAQVQSMDSSGYVTFGFSPVTLKAGTRTLSVLADIINGSSRNFQFQIRNVADVSMADSQYGVVTGSTTSFPVGSASSNSINQGTMTIVKAANSPSGNITDGSSDVVLAKYTVTAYGEAQKIETITAAASSSDSNVGSLRNGRILIGGVQYGSTATLNNSAAGTSYTLNYTVQPGTPVTLEIHADMFDNSGSNDLGNNDTVTAYIFTGSSNVQKMTSLGYNSVPSANVAGNALTDVTGSISLSKNLTYASQTVPVPQTQYKVSSFNLVGSSSEDITVSSIGLALSASTTLTTLNNVKVTVAGNMFGTIKSTVAITNGGVGATSTYSGNYTLKQNTTVPVEVWADITTPGVAYGSDTITPRIAVDGTTVNSSASVTISAAGQQISFGSASITAAQDTSTPDAAIVAGNQTRTAAAFKFTTTNDQYTISEMVISLNDATNVTSIVLKKGSEVIATLPGAASSTFSNLSIPAVANQSTVVTVDLVLGNTGYGAGTSGADAKVTLHSYKSAPVSSGTISSTTNQVVSGNSMYVYKAIPTITNTSWTAPVLSAGTQSLYKFTMTSGGSIGWAKLGFVIATSTGVTVTSPTLWDEDAGQAVAGTSSTSYSGGNLTFEFVPYVEKQISTSRKYSVKATVAISGTGAKSVSTSMSQPTSSYAAPVIAATATATPSTFVWSDLSAQNHSLATQDWNKDYLVKNLPTDSQTLSASY